MWQTLIEVNQLKEKIKLRIAVTGDQFDLETIFEVLKVGDYYFAAQVVEQNGVKLPLESQIMLPFSIINIAYHGFEVLID